jgi:ubiquinone/menaquinone biosynthesis C-methylase UbiE
MTAHPQTPPPSTPVTADRGQVSTSAAQVYEDFFVPALFAQFADRTLEAADVQPGHRLLDVGCGTGVVARAAVPRVRPGRVTGLDPNPGMLAVARTLAPDVQWHRGTAEALPFEDASVDRLTCQFALMFFEDPLAALHEARRVLVENGKAAFAVWDDLEHSPGYAAMTDLVRRLLGEAAAGALRAPFALGDASGLQHLLEQALDDVTVQCADGSARFPSVDAWVHTDIRGWTLAEKVDDAGYELLLTHARRELAVFADSSGRVRFPVRALIARVARSGHER